MSWVEEVERRSPVFHLKHWHIVVTVAFYAIWYLIYDAEHG